MIRRLVLILSLVVLIGFAVGTEIRQRVRPPIEGQSDQLKQEHSAETDAEARTGEAEGRKKLDLDLLNEAGWGRVARVRYLLDSGADVNAKDANGDTPLIIASFLGFSETVELLLERGADVDAKNSIGNTALIEAAAMNKLETVEVLLSRGADTEIRNLAGLTAADASLRENHMAVANLLRSGVRGRPDQPASHIATDAGLQKAAINGDISKLRSLLAAAAPVNARGKDGWTALMHAASRGNAAAVSLLLAAKADPNLKDPEHGRTALILATMYGHADVVQALLKSGADPNAKDKSGNTPMSIVQQSGHRHLGLLLKQAGAKTPHYNQIVSKP